MRERIEIQLDPKNPIEMSILAIIDVIGSRNNHSRSKVTKGIVLLFAPAAAAIADLDVNRQQQKIISRLMEEENQAPPSPLPSVLVDSSLVDSSAISSQGFTPIQGF